MTERPLDPQVPYREIVEHLPVVVYVATDDVPVARTIYMSPNVEDVLGYAPSVFLAIGQDWTSLMHPDDVAPMEARYAETRAGGEPFEMEYRFVHPDGRVVWVHDRAMLVADRETGERVWQGVLEDITPRVDAEQAVEVSAARYATLLENLPAVVYEMVPDDDRRTRYVNRKIEDLLGYTMEEWLDQQDMWMEVLHPDDREVELAAHDLHSSTGDPWRREYRLIGADGQVVWVRDHAALMRDPDGNPVQWQGVMIDITAEKEAQQAIERANDELEFRVRARTAQLEQANEAMGLEIAERQRAENERDRASGRLVPAPRERARRRSTSGRRVSVRTASGSPTSARRSRSMLGYTPEEWNDADWRERIHPHDRLRIEEAAQASIDEGVPFQLEYRYLARDGSVVWVLDRATLRDAQRRGRAAAVRGRDDGRHRATGGGIRRPERDRAARRASRHGDRRALLLRARRRRRTAAAQGGLREPEARVLPRDDRTVFARGPAPLVRRRPPRRPHLGGGRGRARVGHRCGPDRRVPRDRRRGDDRLARRPDAVRGARRERSASPVRRHDHRRDRPAQRT